MILEIIKIFFFLIKIIYFISKNYFIKIMLYKINFSDLKLQSNYPAALLQGHSDSRYMRFPFRPYGLPRPSLKLTKKIKKLCPLLHILGFFLSVHPWNWFREKKWNIFEPYGTDLLSKYFLFLIFFFEITYIFFLSYKQNDLLSFC